PIFTPARKNDQGHDENITLAQFRNDAGADLANLLEHASLALYGVAAEHAAAKSVLIADTKFEFGFIEGTLTLIDELLTPDSSRFWDAGLHQPGRDQPSFDKQFLRDWLESTGWDKTPPAPEIPSTVVAGTANRYLEAYKRIT